MVRRFLWILPLLLLAGCGTKDNTAAKFYGNVDVRTVSLAFRVPGRLEDILFDEGQKVKKGALLARLDSALYAEQLKQIDAQIDAQEAQLKKLEKGFRPEEISKARANYMKQQALMEKADKDLKRAKYLYKSKSITDQEYDDAVAMYAQMKAGYLYAKSSLELLQNGYESEDILAARAALNGLKAQRALAEINLNDTNLTAPSDGTVITRIYEPGAIVNASQSVLELAKEDSYWVRSYMPEPYLGKIKLNQVAHIHTDSGHTYTGRVSFISPLAEFTPKTVQTEELRTDLVYRFRIVLEEYDDSVKQGMPVTVVLEGL